MRAECVAEGTDPSHAPAEDCTCGFYAMNSLELLLPIVDLHHAEEGETWSGTIAGRVELAGKVIEHDRGYRAERARIVELFPIEVREDDGARLARLLGLPVGAAVAGVPFPPTRPPTPPRRPSTVRLRVRDWVRPIAA